MRRRTIRPSTGAGILAALAVLVAGSLPAQGVDRPGPSVYLGAAADLEPCTVHGVEGLASCGVLIVHEDRIAQAGRTIPINIVLLSASGEGRAADPLFVLAGGPGQAATVDAIGTVARLADVRASRDIVLIDVRGTGGSNPLHCAPASPQELLDFLAWGLPDSLVAECLRAFDADPTLYTTEFVVGDLDDVRAALGYEKVNLYGTSYGSRVALVYARRHPERVRSLVLNSVVPPDVSIPFLPAPNGHAALLRRFAACAADDVCDSRYPDPAGDLAAVLARLSTSAEPGAFIDPVTGDTTAVWITRENFAGGLQFALYVPVLAERLPEVLALAAEGDFSPFLQVATPMAAMLPHSIHLGMFFSVTCSEDAAALERMDEEVLALVSEGTFLGGTAMKNHGRVCAAWPRALLPDDAFEPVYSIAPTLLISGELDPITPPALAERARRHLPNSRHLVVTGAGHGPDNRRVAALIHRFLHAGSLENLDLNCVDPPALEERGPS